MEIDPTSSIREMIEQSNTDCTLCVC